MLETIIMLLLGVFESFLIYRLAEYMLTFRYDSKYRYVPLGGICLIFNSWYLLSRNLDSSMMIGSKLVCGLLIYLVLWVCYTNTPFRKLATLLLYLLFCVLGEAVLLLLSLLTPYRLPLNEIMAIPFVSIMFNLFSRFILLYIIEVFGKLYKGLGKSSTGYTIQLRIILIFNAINFYTILYFFSTEQIYDKINTLVLMVSTVNILFVSLLCAFIIMKIEKRTRKELEYKLALRQMEMENKLNEDMGSIVTKLRSMRHDMNNHFTIMTGLIDQEEYVSLKDYVSGLRDDASEADQFILLENKTLTVLLNNKLAKAGAHEIQFNTEITTDQIPLSDLDLCTLLGNMIDNAIEACLQVEGSRYINLSIRQKGSMLKILCENPYAKEPNLLNNRFLTTKEDSSIHGIGIQNMKHVAKKYDAELDFRFGNGVFVTEVMM